MVDRTAACLGLDPFETRRRHDITQDMYPDTMCGGYRDEHLLPGTCLEWLYDLIGDGVVRAEQVRLRGQGVISVSGS
jgi:CO/xanthine dehydrogenase Mo-binding subunit